MCKCWGEASHTEPRVTTWHPWSKREIQPISNVLTNTARNHGTPQDPLFVRKCVRHTCIVLHVSSWPVRCASWRFKHCCSPKGSNYKLREWAACASPCESELQQKVEYSVPEHRCSSSLNTAAPRPWAPLLLVPAVLGGGTNTAAECSLAW